MPIDDLLDEAFGPEKPKIVEVSIERLRPPPITKGESKLAIDFSYLTNNSSFQRAIIEFIKKYIPGFENVNSRGSKEIVTKSFNENANNYRLVMTELKEKLKERREKE